MSLKFGLLVLLLAVDGVFSEERIPTVPTVNLRSALPQIPRFRRAAIQNHHASVQGLQSNSFRRSLLATGVACAWDSDRKECSVSLSSMRSLLEGSETEFARLLLGGLTCVEKTKKKDCNNEKACVWDNLLDECYYGDMRRGHEDSPCAKAAPRFFDSMEAWTTCQKVDSRKRCERKKQCAWYSDVASCEDDSDFIFFGIKNFGSKADQVIDSREPTVRSEYEALKSSDNFTWQSYLDYEPSSIQCPSGVDPLVCEFFDASWSVILGPTYYCLEKYESAASDCSADALCRWSAFSARCIVARSVSASANFAALTVLTDSMPDGQDKRILEAIFACERFVEKGSCNGACIWYTPPGGCTARYDRVATLLTEAGKNTTDALCTFLAVDGFSDCYTQYTKKKCHKVELCRWFAEDECQPNNEFYVAASADRDPEIKKRYQTLKKQCLTYTTKKTCMKPSKVY